MNPVKKDMLHDVHRKGRASLQGQQGVALFVTLMIVLVITVLGLAALRMGLMQSSVSMYSKNVMQLRSMASSGVEVTERLFNANAMSAGNLFTVATQMPSGGTRSMCISANSSGQVVSQDNTLCSDTDYFDSRKNTRINVTLTNKGEDKTNTFLFGTCVMVVEATSTACVVQPSVLFSGGACDSRMQVSHVQEFSKTMLQASCDSS